MKRTPQGDIALSIKTHGCAIFPVSTGSGYFAYTIGLSDHGSAEVIMYARNLETLMRMMSNVVGHVLIGKMSFEPDIPLDDFANVPVVFKHVPEPKARERAAHAFYWFESKGVVPNFLQLVLPDRSSRFHWEPGFDSEFMAYQEDLSSTVLIQSFEFQED